MISLWLPERDQLFYNKSLFQPQRLLQLQEIQPASKTEWAKSTVE